MIVLCFMALRHPLRLNENQTEQDILSPKQERGQINPVGSSKIQRAMRNVGFGVVERVISLGLTFILRTMMIYTLGSEYLGLNNLFISILQILNLAELGVGSAIIFCMYRPIIEHDEETICALLKLFRVIYRTIGVVIFVTGLCLMPFIRFLIAGEIRADVNIYILYFIHLINTSAGYMLFAYRGALLLAHQRNDIPAIVQLAVDILKSLVQMIALLVLHNYYVYVIALPMASITGNILNAYFAKHYYPQYVCRGSVSPELKKNIKEKTFALVGVKITTLIYNSVDSVVISSFLGLVVLAQYNNYYYIMQALIAIITVMYNSIVSIVGTSIVTQTHEKNYDDYMNLSFLNAWVVGWCTVCLYCLYQPFMQLWVGTELMMEDSIAICFCVYFYVFQLMAVQNTYKDAAGLWKEDLRRSYTTNLVNLVSNLILVQVIGVYGILFSTIFALLVVSYPWQTKMIHQKLFHCSMAPYLLRLGYYTAVTILGCAVTGIACGLVQSTDFVGLILRGIICCVLPNIIFLVCFFRLKEFRAALGIVKQLLHRQ